VVALDAERGRRGGSFMARIAAEAFQHQLHHVTLAMVRRRRVGEDEQFHFGFTICDIRFAQILNSEIVNPKP
jgi:hypothetical protein